MNFCIIFLFSGFSCFVTAQSKIPNGTLPTNRDARVLVIGGYDASEDRYLSSLELYHPFNASLDRVLSAQLSHLRSGPATALMEDGTVLIVGGHAGWGRYVSTCERYDPQSDTVAPCPSLNSTRSAPGWAILDHILYVCGGVGGKANQHLNSCERFVSNQWQYAIPMNTTRAALAMVSLDGYLYAIGGVGTGVGGQGRWSSVERWTSSDKVWTEVQSMRRARVGHAAAVLDGQIYVCGGRRLWDPKRSCERYNPRDDRWSLFVGRVADMNQARQGFSLLTYGQYLFAVCGDEQENSNEIYHSSNNTWELIPSKFSHKRDKCRAVLLT